MRSPLPTRPDRCARTAFGLPIVAVFLAFVPAILGAEADGSAQAILKDCGWSRGICLSLDADGAECAVALARNSELSVYRMEATDDAVRRTRLLAEAAGLSPLRIRVEQGPIEALEYPVYCANVIVADAFAKEVERLLRPAGGRVYLKTANGLPQDGYKTGVPCTGFTVLERPPLKGGGEWTHYANDPSNNRYNADAWVRAPLGVLWYGGPATHRGGLWFGQGQAANGLLYLTDVSPDNRLRCVVTARDAYNGIVQWQREVGGDRYLWRAPLGKEVSWVSVINAPGKIHPGQMAIAAGRLYAADGRRCLVLDAASGKDVAAFDAPAPTASGNIWTYLAVLDGLLVGFAAPSHVTPGESWRYRGTPPEKGKDGGPPTLFALDPADGTVKWVRGAAGDELGDAFEAPLAIEGGRVFVGSDGSLHAIDLQSGKTLWKQDKIDDPKKVCWEGVAHKGRFYLSRYSARFYMRTLSAPTLVFDARDGKRLAEDPLPDGKEKGPDSITDGLLYSPATPRGCGLATAAGNLVFGRNGYLSYDPERKAWDGGEYQGARAACLVGAVPAGGVVHLLPNWGCTCRPFHATVTMIHEPTAEKIEAAPVPAAQGTGAGPAVEEQPAGADDWPTYRQNPARTAVTRQDLSRAMKVEWETQIDGDPTSPIAVGDLVFVGSSDECVRALDASTGKEGWRFYAAGPIRASPCYWNGRIYFGAEDGWVYALAAADGRLLWRQQAAPFARKQAGFGRLVSAWPVKQGLAVDGGRVFFTAGRVPGQGVYTGALDAMDGRVLWRAFDLRGEPTSHLVVGSGRIFVPLESNRGTLTQLDCADGRPVDTECTPGKVAEVSFYAGSAADAPEWAKGFVVIGGGGVDRFSGQQSKGNAYHLTSPFGKVASSKGHEFETERSFFPVAGQDNIYFGYQGVLAALPRSKAAQFLALRRASPREDPRGELLSWKQPELPCGPPEWAAIAGGAEARTLLVGGPKGVAAVDASNGRIRWSVAIDGPTPGPAVTRGKVFLAAPGGKLYGLAAK